MSLQREPQRLDPMETVRQAYVLLRAASEHFERLLVSLPIETQNQLLDKLHAEVVRSFVQRISEIGQTRQSSTPGSSQPSVKGQNKKRVPLKEILLEIVHQHPQGLSLQTLLDKVEGQYQSKSQKARHVVRTTIAKLLRGPKTPWQFTEGLHKPWPF